MSKSELKDVNNRITMSPMELVSVLGPTLERMCQMPMPGDIAPSLAKNYRSVVDAMNKANEVRRKKMITEGWVEVNEKGEPVFEVLDGEKIETPKFVSNAARSEFNKWNAEWMDTAKVTFTAHILHVDRVRGIPSIPPSLLHGIKSVIFDPAGEPSEDEVTVEEKVVVE